MPPGLVTTCSLTVSLNKHQQSSARAVAGETIESESPQEAIMARRCLVAKLQAVTLCDPVILKAKAYAQASVHTVQIVSLTL